MTAAIVVAVVVLVVLAGLAVFAAARRNDRDRAEGVLSRETRARDRARLEPAPPPDAEATPSGRDVERAAVLARREGGEIEKVPAAPVAWVPPDPETVGVTRRQFFNRSIVAFMGLGLAGFGASVLAFLWPRLGEGFGAPLQVGSITDLQAQIQANNGFLYNAEGRMWLVEYPASALTRAEQIYPPNVMEGLREGVLALYQKCPHLGCRVPECVTSQWFECPCHGTLYNKVGERRAGPAPRGMDRFAMSVSGGVLTVDTGTIIQGPPLGTNTTGQEPEGPSCIGAS